MYRGHPYQIATDIPLPAGMEKGGPIPPERTGCSKLNGNNKVCTFTVLTRKGTGDGPVP